MKSKNFIGLIAVICGLCLILTACSCEHEFDDGVVTKEPTCTSKGVMTYTCALCGETKDEDIPMTEHTYESEVTKPATFSETGEITYTCSVCGDSYVETIPTREDEIAVTVTDKVNIAEDWSAGRYSDRVLLTFHIENKTDQTIKGIQGILTISDLFGDEILTTSCDFTGHSVAANSAIDIDDLGMDINPFMDDHTTLYDTDFADLQFEYDIRDVVFDDEQGSENASSEAPLDTQPVIVNVTDKINLSENWDAGRYSPVVQFTFSLTNTTDKDIKGVQGILTIKDLFGADIMSLNCDFTGNVIPANGSISVDSLGLDVNEFIDEHVKLYNEDYSDLMFEYSITSIVYTDGSVE